MKLSRLNAGWFSMALAGLLPAAAFLADGESVSSPVQSQSGHRWVNLDPLESEPPLKIGQQRQLLVVFWHEGIYFGLGNMLESEIRGDVELHLWVSRDGRRWEQPFPREAFISRGPRGDFDDMIAWFGLAVIQGRSGAVALSGPDGRYLVSVAKHPFPIHGCMNLVERAREQLPNARIYLPKNPVSRQKLSMLSRSSSGNLRNITSSGAAST